MSYKAIEYLQKVFNHDSIETTLKYIGADAKKVAEEGFEVANWTDKRACDIMGGRGDESGKE